MGEIFQEGLADLGLPPETLTLGTFLIFWVNFFINLFFLVVSYLLLRKKEFIISFKFLKYTFFVTVVGFFIDFSYYFLDRLIPDFINWLNRWFFIGIVISLLIGGFNFWFSKKMFRLTKKEAIFVGVVMAIFTNPLILPIILVSIFIFISDILFY